MNSSWRLATLADPALIASAAGGDSKAFGELTRRHGSAVRGLLRRMGAQPALADDLAQDAFLIAFQRIGDFRGDGSFLSWVRKIAARLYLRTWRRKERLEPLSGDELDPSTSGEGAAARRIDIDEALQTLSETERLCILLCFTVGFSHGEAAEALNAPLGTVKSHVKRGLDKLRARLGEGDAAHSRSDRNG